MIPSTDHCTQSHTDGRQSRCSNYGAIPAFKFSDCFTQCPRILGTPCTIGNIRKVLVVIESMNVTVHIRRQNGGRAVHRQIDCALKTAGATPQVYKLCIFLHDLPTQFLVQLPLQLTDYSTSSCRTDTVPEQNTMLTLTFNPDEHRRLYTT